MSYGPSTLLGRCGPGSTHSWSGTSLKSYLDQLTGELLRTLLSSGRVVEGCFFSDRPRRTGDEADRTRGAR